MVASGQAVLELDDLLEGRNAFSFEMSAEELELEDEFFSFPSLVKAEIEVWRSMDSFKLEGVVSWRIAGDCYRCLKEVEEGVEARFRLLIQRRQASPEELESAEEDGFIEIVDPGTRQVDLRDHIREAVVLDLPMRIPTASEGRCPQCDDDLAGDFDSGKEEGTDPRWAVLGQIEFTPTEESTRKE